MTGRFARGRVAALTAVLATAAIAAGVLSAGALGSAKGGGGGMGGMKMPTPVPIQPLGTRMWQGMKIQARLTTALPFVVFQGTSSRMVKPTKKDDAHLMVMLSDAQTGMAIPYGTVWATIRKNGKVVYDQRQWPMISRAMGTHFGNDISLPGSGTYKLTLLIGPPQAARHMEYAHVWLKPHRVTMTFHWKKPK
jgi:uncharacterized protein involved in high-affinity Fe2+ transport